MAARALWKGVVEFEALSVPVKLYTAVRPQEIRLRQLHDQDLTPVKQVYECPREKKEVPWEHVVKGYEVHRDQYVIVRDEDLEGCDPQASRSIRVREFVDAAAIDPIYMERAYWLGPDQHGEKGYALLVHALKESRRAGISQFVMRGKSYLAALAERHNALVLQTLRYADEVERPEKVLPELHGKKPSGAGALNERELKAAEQLIESLSVKFEPEKYQDEYRACLMKVIEAKAAGRQVELKPAPERKPTKAPDLVEVLKASLVEAKKRRRTA